MRIVKLSDIGVSPDDDDMKDIDSVHTYFSNKLPERNKGKFYFKKNPPKNSTVKIAEDGLKCGEPLVFSYKDKNKKPEDKPRIVYIADAQTGVEKDEKGRYFKVNMNTLVEGNGERLNELGKRLKELGKIQNEKLEGSQGWNRIKIDDDEARGILQDFAAQPLGGSKNPLLVFNVAWMHKYQGNEDGTDIPRGSMRYVVEQQKCGEMWNFLDIKGTCYGFGMTKDITGKENFSGVDLGQLVDSEQSWKKEDKASNIDVIFTSQNPESEERCVVGWYKDATVWHKHYNQMEGREHFGYLCRTDADNSFLVKEKDRVKIPYDVWGNRNRSFFYAEKYHELAQWLRKHINEGINKADRSQGVARAYNINKDEIRQIEKNAEDETMKHYRDKGYKVKSVAAQKCGWDLEARKDGEILYIEVKGHKGPNIQFELTPNEYSKMKKYYRQYRVCVVCNALSDRKLTETMPCEKNGKWFLHEVKSDKAVVELEEKIAAAAKSL